MKMPLLRLGCISVAAFAFAGSLLAQTPEAPKVVFPDASPLATLKQRVGVTDIEVVYSRPSLKGRTALGGLLAPYGKIWRTGANNATRITFSADVKVQGSALAAGTYELFSIPDKNEWTVIFQKPAKQWGSYAYKQDNDVLRVTAKPTALSQSLESLTIELGEFSDTSATLSIAWEKTRVPLKIDVGTVSTLVPQIEAAMAAPGEKKPYVPAAMFYLDNDLDLKKALEWMTAAVAANPNAFYLGYRKAKVQAKMGDKAGAIATAKESIAIATKANQGEVTDEYVRLNNELIASLK
jgi:hypothetical protein